MSVFHCIFNFGHLAFISTRVMALYYLPN